VRDGTSRGHHDAEFSRRGDIDGRVACPGAHQQFESGQPGQQFGREPGALTHRDEHVDAGEPLDDLVGVGERFGEHLDLGVEGVPVGKAQCDVLVVVKDRDLHASQATTRTFAEVLTG
jgi:hypothetical protein